MTISMNYLLSGVIILGLIIAVIVVILMNSKKDDNVARKEYRTIWDVVSMVKDYMVEMLSADIAEDVSDEEFDRLYRRVAKIRTANKNATFGMDAAKALIKDIIAGAIEDELLDTELDNILGMGPGQTPSTHTMFEALMQVYKSRYGKAALAKWIADYKLAEPRMQKGQRRYFITIEDVYQSYLNENINFTRKEKVKLLSTLVYQLYRGFGIIDTVREMNIDGLNIGTSGSILSNLEGNTVRRDDMRPEEEATRGCWLYFSGRYIHLRFMNFSSQNEIRRIVNLLVRYNSSGTLTAKRGYMVNTMYDKSRLLAFRPPVAEYWAAFIRKFTLGSVTVETLVCKDNVENGELAVTMIKNLMYGLVTSIITGRQGSGKTTLMSAMIEYVDPVYNIRILEMSPELYLRELYKDRNILSAQETQYVSASEIQNAFKKSDSAMSVCGEIATSALACRWLEFARVASIMNLATHHANTTEDLVIALANNLVDELHTTVDAAIQQVIDLLKIDIHLDYTKEGFRYIERISEVVPLSSEPYESFEYNRPVRDSYGSDIEFQIALQEYDIKLKEYHARIDREYYSRSTDRKKFAVNQLLHFDLKTMSYITDNPPTPDLVERMKRNMSEQQIKDFDNFLLEQYEIKNVDNLIIDLTDGAESEDASIITDADVADQLLQELEDESAVTEGLIDMADAIDAVRHRQGGAYDEADDFGYTGDESHFGMDAVDQLVAIDAEEDAKKHSELYAPLNEGDIQAMIEREHAQLRAEGYDLADVDVEAIEEVTTDDIATPVEAQIEQDVASIFSTVAANMQTSNASEDSDTDDNTDELVKNLADAIKGNGGRKDE